MNLPGGSAVKNLSAMQETQVQSLGQQDPLEKEMATHPSILAWKVPWTEEPGGIQSMRSQRVGHNLETKQPQYSYRQNKSNEQQRSKEKETNPTWSQLLSVILSLHHWLGRIFLPHPTSTPIWNLKGRVGGSDTEQDLEKFLSTKAFLCPPFLDYRK